MNCTLCRPTDTELNENFVQGTMTVAENAYATVPMVAVKTVYQQPDEEELHTSFEEAISDRLIALHSRLDRISKPLSNTQDLHYDTDPVLSASLKNTTATLALGHVRATHSTDQLKPSPTFSHPMVNSWQRIMIFACLALMFMLLGFDVMGSLVLHMH